MQEKTLTSKGSGRSALARSADKTDVMCKQENPTFTQVGI